jgi:hypothetical protein
LKRSTKTLEALLSSQSVWSTIESQLSLRQASLTSALLLSLWCLSPLGGQASLRILHKTTAVTSTSVPLRYLSTGPASAIIASSPKNSIADLAFSTAITPSADVQPRPEDLWGNIKIPRLESLTEAADNDGWIAVPNNVSPEDYSSLLGLPVVGRPRNTELAFNVESTYYTTDCDPFIQLPFAQNWTQAIIDRLSHAM